MPRGRSVCLAVSGHDIGTIDHGRSASGEVSNKQQWSSGVQCGGGGGGGGSRARDYATPCNFSARNPKRVGDSAAEKFRKCQTAAHGARLGARPWPPTIPRGSSSFSLLADLCTLNNSTVLGG